MTDQTTTPAALADRLEKITETDYYTCTEGGLPGDEIVSAAHLPDDLREQVVAALRASSPPQDVKARKAGLLEAAELCRVQLSSNSDMSARAGHEDAAITACITAILSRAATLASHSDHSALTTTSQSDEAGLLREARKQVINTPETADFMAGVPLEAAHQRDRWGTDHNAGKTPFDWFWLIGYLAQKAAQAHVDGNAEKALHHTISTAAALANWHAAISGASNAMRPGIDDAHLSQTGDEG